MNKAILIRTTIYPSAIIGELFTSSHSFVTLERPWLDNRRNVSCIPAGKYQCSFITSAGKFKNVFLLKCVPGRDGVLIHSGVTVDHTRGCILVGLTRGQFNGRPAIFNSFTARDQLVTDMERKSFELEIIGDQSLEGGRS
jgi:hypothetical protein